MVSGADGLRGDVGELRIGPGEVECDGFGGVEEALDVFAPEVDAAVHAFEGFKDAIAAMDEVVVCGDEHERGVCDDALEDAGVECEVAGVVWAALGREGGGGLVRVQVRNGRHGGHCSGCASRRKLKRASLQVACASPNSGDGK